MITDKKIAILVDVGSVVEAHLLGREREGKQVLMLGRRWMVDLTRECDGKRLVQLLASLPE